MPPDSIRMVMADTQLTPYDRGTFGSQTTPIMSRQLRRTAAAAREALLDLAAETWKVGRNELTAADGAVVRAGTKETIPYGKLTQGRKLTKAVSDEAPTTPADKWTVSGHTVAKVDGRSFVTGGHQYTSDIRLPGMLYGKVLRSPTYHATLASVDLSAAKAMPDVIVIRDGDFVGVAAPSRASGRAGPRGDQGRVEARAVDLGQGPVPRAEAAGRPAAARAPAGAGTGAVAAGAGRTRTPAPSPRASRPRTSARSRPTRSPTSRTPRWSPARRWPSGRTASSPSGPARSGRSASAAS